MLERLSFLFRWKVATMKRHSCSDMLIRDQNPTATQIAHFSFLRPLPWVSTNLSSVHHQLPHLRLGLGVLCQHPLAKQTKSLARVLPFQCPLPLFPLLRLESHPISRMGVAHRAVKLFAQSLVTGGETRARNQASWVLPHG